MKKALLGTFVTLFIMLALISCDSIIGDLGAGNLQQKSPDGQPLIRVNIPTGEINGSRSITTNNDIADIETDYVEVIFKYGGKEYRTSGYRGTTLSVDIPSGNYDYTNTVMLVGKKSDGTLLGTGKIEPPSLGTLPVVVPGDPTIKFNVTYLSVDLVASVNSSFMINETSGSPTPINSLDPYTNSTTPWDTQTYAGTTTSGPCFQVPTSVNDIKASLTFDGFANIGSNIILSGMPVVTFTEFGNSLPLSINLDSITPSTTGASVGVAGKFDIQFDTTIAEGICMVAFKIPVAGFAVSSVASDPKWYIRGGTKIGQPDFLGNEENGIVLAVLNAPSTSLNTITISGF